MFRSFVLGKNSCGRIVRLTATLAGATVFLSPCTLLAQRHGGGGASAGTGGLSSIGKPSGVDQKDDLKDFHDALAVQATSQQIVEYKAMVKSTTAASAELQSFLLELDKKESVSTLTGRDETLKQALERARTENKNFLGGFSETQKTGLKEITKKVTKADFDLGQHWQELTQRIADSKESSEAIGTSAKNLVQAVTIFQNEQASLGQEMGIVNPDGEEFTFDLAPVKQSIDFQNQPVVIITSGAISNRSIRTGQSSYTVRLTEDIFDLQQNITQVLRTQLNKDERCGERISVRNAILTPTPPTSLVFVQLHFERWTCLGGQNNEIAEGEGSLEVKLTPKVAQNGTLNLIPTMGRVDAEGLLGESLRSGSLGSDLLDKIAETVLSTVRQGGDFKVLLPLAAQSSATLSHAQFQTTGAGSLTIILDGDVRLSGAQATALASELKRQTPSRQPVLQQDTPR